MKMKTYKLTLYEGQDYVAEIPWNDDTPNAGKTFRAGDFISLSTLQHIGVDEDAELTARLN
jgi:hypothetical protein